MLKYTNENEFKILGLVILYAVNCYFLIKTVVIIMMVYLNKH